MPTRMDAEWIKSPTGQRVVGHWADARPAWLWSQDGQSLIWHNPAALLFNARVKKHGGIKRAGAAVPIKGQVGRLIRLGTTGRSSLSRLQFLAGDRPVSATCSCTPLLLPNGQAALLIVGVDAIDRELLATAPEIGEGTGIAAPEGEHLFVAADGGVSGGSAMALRQFAPLVEDGAIGLAPGESGELVSEGTVYQVSRIAAGAGAASLILFVARGPAPEAPVQVVSPPEDVAEPVAEPRVEPAVDSPDEPVADWPDEPVSDLRDEPVTDLPEEPVSALSEEPATGPADTDLSQWQETDDEEPPPLDDETAWHGSNPVEPGEIGQPPLGLAAAEPVSTPNGGRLSTLFDRLAGDENLFTPLGERDDHAPAVPEREEPEDGEADEPTPVLYTVTGRGFIPLEAEAPASEPADSPEPAAEPEPVETPRDSESVERVSRYNFDELSRILTDRVSGDPTPTAAPASAPSIESIIAASEAPLPAPTQTGALINLGGETLVLNRLPLGILVFRDQQVLFANRAITEMIGYESVEALRAAGLASIFPAGDDAQSAGPVNHIVQRSGALVPVTARLQSISWQGRPALMLSASTTEVRTGHEIAVRAFAEALAEARGDGFIEANRSGVISLVSAQARIALNKSETQLLGRPLSAVVAPEEIDGLKTFLERPARFAETARPALSVKATERGVDLLLFAQGQAGVVTGYFGLVRQREVAQALAARGPGEAEPALLARISRSVRRPLNTIIGFSDLIRTSAFGVIDNPRYLEYAQDIKTAGYEIAALVDELDDYTRLKDGRYAPRHADVDLAALLDSCIARVRAQASAARVLVRSAISERLPKVTADRASLGQAVLNLLASAIDQTPVGGSVVLSAQLEDDGSVSIHVRDSAATTGDLSERFVVFRDGIGRDGEVLAPVRSSVGLALTRSLLAVNAFTLSVAPTGGTGMLFSMSVPADLVAKA